MNPPPASVQDSSGGMIYVTGVSIRITGMAHNNPFNHGEIEAGVTPLHAHRELGISTLTDRPFEVRRDDYQAVVLNLSRNNPNSSVMTDEERRDNHCGYIGFGTAERNAIVE